MELDYKRGKEETTGHKYLAFQSPFYFWCDWFLENIFYASFWTYCKCQKTANSMELCNFDLRPTTFVTEKFMLEYVTYELQIDLANANMILWLSISSCIKV